MNSKIKNRTLGATALLAVLLGSAACGNETVTDNDTQPGAAAHNVPPAAEGEQHGPISADAAERKAAADKARQDRASADRWARGTQIEGKLKSGHPSQP
jgi:hypothetical protein